MIDTSQRHSAADVYANHKPTYIMKHIICKNILAAAALLGLVSISQAAPNLVLPKNYDKVVKSSEECEKLPAGSRVALSCTSCKTLIEKKAEDKKGWAAWFKGEAKHDCPGCHGQVTLKGTKTNNVLEHTHVCSKCGDNSAFTCAGHAK